MTVRLVDWADEEGARFGRSLLGSSAVAGHARPRRRARPARRRGHARCRTRWRPAASTSTAPAPRRRGSTARCAYLELHIEQGPVLLDTGRLASAVSGTFGDERYLITLHRPVRARGLDADAPAPRLARRRGDRRARDPRGRHPPRRRLRPSARMHGRPGRDHRDRGRDRDDARPAPPRRRRAGDDARRVPRGVRARRRETFDCEVAPRRVFGATPTPFHPRLVELARAAVDGGRRRRRRRRSRPARCTTRPRSAGSCRP